MSLSQASRTSAIFYQNFSENWKKEYNEPRFRERIELCIYSLITVLGLLILNLQLYNVREEVLIIVPRSILSLYIPSVLAVILAFFIALIGDTISPVYLRTREELNLLDEVDSSVSNQQPDPPMPLRSTPISTNIDTSEPDNVPSQLAMKLARRLGLDLDDIRLTKEHEPQNPLWIESVYEYIKSYLSYFTSSGMEN